MTRVYTVCIEHEERESKGEEIMWHDSFTNMADAMVAVTEDWLGMFVDRDPPRLEDWHISVQFEDSVTNGECKVFDDTNDTGYRWTIMGTNLQE